MAQGQSPQSAEFHLRTFLQNAGVSLQGIDQLTKEQSVLDPHDRRIIRAILLSGSAAEVAAGQGDFAAAKA